MSDRPRRRDRTGLALGSEVLLIGAASGVPDKQRAHGAPPEGWPDRAAGRGPPGHRAAPDLPERRSDSTSATASPAHNGILHRRLLHPDITVRSHVDQLPDPPDDAARSNEQDRAASPAPPLGAAPQGLVAGDVEEVQLGQVDHQVAVAAAMPGDAIVVPDSSKEGL